MIYFTEHILKMVQWYIYVTIEQAIQHNIFQLYKKGNLMNTWGGGNGMKIEQIWELDTQACET